MPSNGILGKSAALGALVGVLMTLSPHLTAQSPAAGAALIFGSDAGVIFNVIKEDKAADFEGVLARLKEALRKSPRPERKQQAASWKVFKSLDQSLPGTVLYIFVIDPVLKGADYSVATILAESFPSEAEALYQQYKDTYASGQNLVSLNLTRLPGSPRK